jgi:predicted O-methyltransferase YrrM
VKTESDRAKEFLNQFENPSQCQDPRSFGFDGSNQYYNLLNAVAKELQPNLVVELGTCTGGSTSVSQVNAERVNS